MFSEGGRGRRPEADALDPNCECYANDAPEAAQQQSWAPASSGPGSRKEEAVAVLPGLIAASRAVQMQIDECVAIAIREGVGVGKLARLLGLHRATLYRRLGELRPPGRSRSA